jgi:hypothetical protein
MKSVRRSAHPSPPFARDLEDLESRSLRKRTVAAPSLIPPAIPRASEGISRHFQDTQLNSILLLCQFLCNEQCFRCVPDSTPIQRKLERMFSSLCVQASMRRMANSQAGTSRCEPICSSGCSRRLLRQILIGLLSVEVRFALRFSAEAPKSRTIQPLPSALGLHSCRSTSF